MSFFTQDDIDRGVTWGLPVPEPDYDAFGRLRSERELANEG
jgi:hypothetical protein